MRDFLKCEHCGQSEPAEPWWHTNSCPRYKPLRSDLTTATCTHGKPSCGMCAEEIVRLREALEKIALSEPLVLRSPADGYYLQTQAAEAARYRDIARNALRQKDAKCRQHDWQTFGPNDLIETAMTVCMNCGVYRTEELRLSDIGESDETRP